jgi:phage protein, HK97 gp10 family
MGAPKSVIKMNKNGITYTSSVDKASYFLFELSRAALRDVSKFIRKTFKESYYTHFKRITGKAGRVTRSKVFSSQNTKYPRVQIGVPHSSKGKSTEGFYAYFQEFGTSKTQGLGLLQKAVDSNIKKIVEIESKYLSALEDEAKALSLIDEEEYDDGED